MPVQSVLTEWRNASNVKWRLQRKSDKVRGRTAHVLCLWESDGVPESSRSSLSSADQTEVDCSPSTENSEQHNLLEQLQSRYRQMEERITCPICIDNHIKLVFQCGHASCIECSAALKTCPLCRQTIRERIQLFVWTRRVPAEARWVFSSLLSWGVDVIRNPEDSDSASPPVTCPSFAAFSGRLLPMILSGLHCFQGCAVVSSLSQSPKGWCLYNTCSSLYIPLASYARGNTLYMHEYMHIVELKLTVVRSDLYLFCFSLVIFVVFVMNDSRCRFLFMCESWILMINILILLFAQQNKNKNVFFLLKFTPSLRPLLRVSKHE